MPYVGIGFVFLFFTLINTLPAVLDLSGTQIGNGGDSYQNMWNFWWFKTAILDLHQNPYFTSYIFYPLGASLALHTLSPIEDIISLPLQFLFHNNLVLVWNLIVISSFVMTGVATYTLTYYLTRNKFAAFLSSYVLTFSPYMMGHGLGHLNLIVIQWIPLFLLSFFKFHEKYLTRYVIWCALLLSLIIVTNSYQTVFLLMFIFIYLIYNLIKKNIILSKKYIAKLLSIFLLAVILVLPYIYNYVTAFFSGLYAPNHDVYAWTPDLIMFFMPGRGSTFIKLNLDFLLTQDWLYRVFRHARFGPENEIYFGYFVLILVIYGLIKVKRQEIRMWIITASVFFIMACGVTLKF